MRHTFRRFLNHPAEKVSIAQVVRAAAHTWRFYRQRRELCSKHYLASYRLPQLYFIQQKADFAQREFVERSKARLLLHRSKDSFFRDKTEVIVDVPHRYDFLKANYPSAAFHPIASLHSFWTAVHVTEGTLGDRVNGTLQNAYRYFKSIHYLDSAAKWLVKYINLYHEALQQLIEGHREVTQDHDTKLDSGKTVKETLRDFENSLVEHLPHYKDLNNFAESLRGKDKK